LGIIAPFLLTVADLAIASLLLLFIRSLGLATTELPGGLPAALAEAGPAAVWVALVGLVSLQGLLFVLAYQSRTLLSEGAQHRLRLVLARYLLPPAGIAPPLSRVSYLASDAIPRTAMTMSRGVEILAFVLQAVTLGTALIWVSPGEAIVGLIGFGVVASCVIGFNRRGHRAASRMPAAGMTLARAYVRASQNWLLIRALRLQDQERARYQAASLDYYRATAESVFFGNLGFAFTPLFALVVIALMALAREYVFGTPPAVFLAFLYLFVRFQYLLAHGAHLSNELFTARPFVAEAVKLVAERSEDDIVAALSPWENRFPSTPRAAVAPGAAPGASAPPPRMEARDLVFCWPGEDRAVIDGLSCELDAGCQLGVVGPNGSGKSTLLALILGAVQPQRGTLLLDGEPAADWAPRHASALGYVGPEPCLIEGTVRENVCYGLDRAAGDDEILEALDRAGFGNAVRSLPGGLDHEVAENGDGLSSGEKQKLALARALLRRPVLLLLDEPTTNVDERSEREIVETLGHLHGHCTVVLVTHERRLLCQADHLVQLPGAVPG
jgi:ABC-type multidrug transport system fused ATPase/permease subunit